MCYFSLNMNALWAQRVAIMANKKDQKGASSRTSSSTGNPWFDQWVRYTSAMAAGAANSYQMPNLLTQMFGDHWLKSVFLKNMDPARLEAMADAGHLIKDAREVAGLSAAEMAEAMGMSDPLRLEAVENGEEVLPFEMIFRSASLVARHDPVPFIMKFMRTYNPEWSDMMDKLGFTALPKQYERERRFINVYRKYDALRKLDDDEFERFIDYIDSSAELVLNVMMNEKEANKPRTDQG